MHGCVLSTVDTDALVLKYQAISIHSAEYIFIVLAQFLTEPFVGLENMITLKKKPPSYLRVKRI